ncbi:MAG: hypothetical protein QXD24_06920 [Candidatus Caldarchaeum sp.]
MAWLVEVFVQGRGWTPLRQVFGHSGVVEGFDEALSLGCSVVLKSVERASRAAGASTGDVVGFRVREVSSEPEPLPPDAVKWDDVRHRFFRRGSAYLLYKSWSWPD